jgi:acetyl esterase/lipase
MPLSLPQPKSGDDPHSGDEMGKRLSSNTPLARPDGLAFTRRAALRTLLAGSVAGSSLPGIQVSGWDPKPPPRISERTRELLEKLQADVPVVVRVSHSISYKLAPREYADSRRLDIYRHRDYKRAPVVVFFHGGAWQGGHRRQYIPLGVSMALGGITCVIPSFTQAPVFRFPEFLKDAAAAVCWVETNIDNLGGDPEKIFVAGHSSGALIASLLALDPRYLEFHHLSPSVLRGVMAISGLFSIQPGFEYAFGTSKDVWAEASPLYYVNPGAPPFLVVKGSEEPPFVHSQTRQFLEALADNEVAHETEEYPGEDHNSMIALASLRNSELQQRLRSFVKSHS